MEIFRKIKKHLKLLNIFPKRMILDTCHSSEYVSDTFIANIDYKEMGKSCGYARVLPPKCYFFLRIGTGNFD